MYEAESSDYLHNILQKLFIGTNTDRSGEQFTALINDISTAEGKEQIFKKLTDLYPENPHYCSHLARLYAYDPKLRNTEKAIELADRAINISERIGRKDHLLYHIKGMCLRSNVYEKINIQLININKGMPVDQDEYDNIIFNLVPRTGMQFEISRKIASDQNKSDEYGFVAHIQLLVRVIDFGAKVAGKPIQEFIVRDNNPFSEWIDSAEILLSEVKRVSSGEDRVKIDECENDILAFYGLYSQIIQNLTNILSKSQNPTIIRRQLVRAYDRKSKNYYNDAKTIRSMMSLMEENINVEPQNEKNYYLWFQAARHSSMPLAEVINKMSQWKAVSTIIDASFYLYILKTLRALEGYSEAMYEAKDLIRETKAKGKSNVKPTEWLGKGKGKGKEMNQLVHYKEVNDINRESKLQLVEGVFTEYRHSGNGTITIANGIEVFFNPTQAKLTSSDLNARVFFYLGFSYDGPKADSTSIRLK
jgi:tetratricopeptide (TPR) repeat protein